MRDPYRIARVIDKLTQAWSRYPDQRFGQLLFNIGYFKIADQYGHMADPYFNEDERLEELIDKFLRNHPA
jgi:hypothetical protein